MSYKLNTCIIPSAGYGTRMFPGTKTIPKEMLTIGSTPILQYAIEEAKSAGLKEMAIVTSEDKREIFDRYFSQSSKIDEIIGDNESKKRLLEGLDELIANCNFNYPIQQEMRGLGHAILQAKNLVGENPFGVILPDDYCINPQGLSIMNQLKNVHETSSNKSIIGLMEVSNEDVSKYGVVKPKRLEDDLISIEDMVEKPNASDAPSNYAIIGRYILRPDTFEILDNTSADSNGEIQLTDALKEQARNGDVLGLVFDGKRFDCGSQSGFRRANADGLTNEELTRLVHDRGLNLI